MTYPPAVEASIAHACRVYREGRADLRRIATELRAVTAARDDPPPSGRFRDWAAEDRGMVGHEVLDMLPEPGRKGEDPWSDRLFKRRDLPWWTSRLAAQLDLSPVDQTRLRLQVLARLEAAGVVERLRPWWENRANGTLYWRLACSRHDAHERWAEVLERASRGRR